jgi:glyoxylase-like metal-dependent hydrolase (beta-lactamase superfamily II)
MAAEEIVSGVYGISIAMGYVNAFLIVGEDGLTLVDSGLPKRKDTILEVVAGVSRQPADLKHILITHHHPDHVGSLADLKEATAASCYVHPADSPIVRGEQRQPGPNPSSLLGKLAGPILERVSTPAPPVTVSVRPLRSS